MEFSPYEIGMAKYGTFMPPGLFGSKFFMGSVVKQYEENPLHFLMGKTETALNFRPLNENENDNSTVTHVLYNYSYFPSDLLNIFIR